jgi:hypothetical protein
MATLEFHLFRAKFVKSDQTFLFEPDLSPSQVFLAAVQEKPSMEVAQGHVWHIGNVESIESTSGYFAFGRTTRSIIEKYDDSQKNFVEEEYEESPYTHVLFDSAIGLVAIARKTRLAPSAKGIAAKLEMLLSNAKIVKQYAVAVDVDFLRDPDSFIRMIQKAYAIKKFTATFGGPNPFDADAYFQRPLSVYLQRANGTKGKATIEGENLNAETIHQVTASVAATGNNASARLQKRRGAKAVTAYLGENQIKVSVNEDDFDKQQVLSDVQERYRSVREA